MRRHRREGAFVSALKGSLFILVTVRCLLFLRFYLLSSAPHLPCLLLLL